MQTDEISSTAQRRTKRCATLVAPLLIGTLTAHAHHSFAPHFDPDSSVTITGTILEFRQRNPHSYLKIEVTGNETQEYECESSGITQLRRNGIDSNLLKVGSTVTVTGEQHRRDPHKCFFRTVQIDDGRVHRISGGGARLGESADDAAEQQSDGIFGNWLLIPVGARAGNGETYESMFDHLTDAGKLAEANYEPIKDDPVYSCHPIGLRRVWYAPDTPTAITRQDDKIIIRHEWMDVERVVYLGAGGRDSGKPREIFGHSTGKLVDGVLTIETGEYPSGLIRQYLGINNEPPFRGLLHSDRLKTTEKLRYDEELEVLEVTMLFEDPGFYSREFPPVITRYEKTDLEIRPFGCTPDD